VCKRDRKKGWKDRWIDVRAVLKIAHSNQKLKTTFAKIERNFFVAKYKIKVKSKDGTILCKAQELCLSIGL
jgi:hypothetical protein